MATSNPKSRKKKSDVVHPGKTSNIKPLTSRQSPRHGEAAEHGGKRLLLDAAAIEFSERGFDGASVLAIARRAGVKQPLVNYHFGSKEGLWRAVIADGYRDTVQIEQTYVANETALDPLARLKLLLLSFARINVRRPSVHAIMQKEVMLPGPRLEWLVDNYMQPYNRSLATLFDECVAKKIFRPIPTSHACVLMTGVMISYFMASELPNRMYPEDLQGDAAAHTYFENAIEVLFSGMLVPAQATKTGRDKKVSR